MLRIPQLFAMPEQPRYDKQGASLLLNSKIRGPTALNSRAIALQVGLE